MNKFTESKIFRQATSAFDVALTVLLIFWIPILVLLFGSLFIWN